VRPAPELEIHSICRAAIGEGDDMMKLEEPALWTTAACADESAASFSPSDNVVYLWD
jgi:hypothetical protein